MKVKCEICGGEFKESKQRKRLSGVNINNVYLDNQTIRTCLNCGNQHYSFHQSPKLFNAIAEAIALQPGPIEGGAAQFLRKNAGVKTSEWAEMIGIDVATVSRWESGARPIPQNSNKLIRVLYFSIMKEKHKTKTPKALNDILLRPLTETSPIIIIDQLTFDYTYLSPADKAAA